MDLGGDAGSIEGRREEKIKQNVCLIEVMCRGRNSFKTHTDISWESTNLEFTKVAKVH